MKKITILFLSTFLITLFSCKKEKNISVDPKEINVESEGGLYKVNVYSNDNWDVHTSQSWVSVSQTSGYGNATIDVTVISNSNTTADKAQILFRITNSTAILDINRKGKEEPVKHEDDIWHVTDCQGNVYRTVWIDNQLWMNENLRCTKYDTESDRPGFELKSTKEPTYTPYYLDGRYAKMDRGGVLTPEQRDSLGFLYNWAAAVGSDDGSYREVGYVGPRQGICPNGWHLPIDKEWNTLKNYIEVIDKQGSDKTGYCLKSQMGWLNNNGIDRYWFHAFPAGYSDGKTVMNVGYDTSFWTATSKSYNEAESRGLSSEYNYLYEGSYDKTTARSVRCVKNW